MRTSVDPMRCTAVLVDFDGLLVSTEFAGWQSWQKLFAEFGGEMPVEDFAARMGSEPVAPWEDLEKLARRTLDRASLEQGRRAHRDELMTVYPGVIEFLVACRAAHMKIAIVSNSPIHWITRQRERVGILSDFFDFVVTSDGLRPKPAPDAYERALELLQVQPSEAVAFEDSEKGIEAARAANVKCVAIPNEITRHQNLVAADYLVGSFHDVKVARGSIACASTAPKGERDG